MSWLAIWKPCSDNWSTVSIHNFGWKTKLFLTTAQAESSLSGSSRGCRLLHSLRSDKTHGESSRSCSTVGAGAVTPVQRRRKVFHGDPKSKECWCRMAYNSGHNIGQGHSTSIGLVFFGVTPTGIILFLCIWQNKRAVSWSVKREQTWTKGLSFASEMLAV